LPCPTGARRTIGRADVNLAATTCEDAAIAPFADSGQPEGLLGPTSHTESTAFTL
jgi:hypothetical protein